MNSPISRSAIPHPAKVRVGRVCRFASDHVAAYRCSPLVRSHVLSDGGAIACLQFPKAVDR